jgi:hypothetical protein
MSLYISLFDVPKLKRYFLQNIIVLKNIIFHISPLLSKAD